MNETSKNLEQKIDMIEGMITLAQDKYAVRNANNMIMMGWIIVIPNVLLFLAAYLNFKPLILVDLIFIVIFGIFLIRRVTRQTPFTHQNLYLNKLISRAYVGIFLSFLILMISFYIMFGEEVVLMPYFWITLLCLYGGVFFMNACFTGIKWLWLFCLPAWLMVLIVAYFGYHEKTFTDGKFINAITFFFGSVIPGYIIKYKIRHEKLSTT